MVDKQAPYEVWVINHALNSQTRVTGRHDRDDAIDIAKRQVINKRKFVEAKVLTSRPRARTWRGASIVIVTRCARCKEVACRIILYSLCSFCYWNISGRELRLWARKSRRN